MTSRVVLGGARELQLADMPFPGTRVRAGSVVPCNAYPTDDPLARFENEGGRLATVITGPGRPAPA